MASVGAYIQCVVAGRPSSRPAAASTKAPVHRPTMRAPSSWARRSASSASAGGGEVIDRQAGTTTVAGPADRLQAVRRGEFEPTGGAQRSFLAAADQQAVAGNSRVLPVDSENGERDGALEDRAAAEQQHGNDFPASPPGQLACGLGRGGGVLAHDAKPPRCSRLPGPYGPVAPARFPSVSHVSPVSDFQDRIYCVAWSRRDTFPHQLNVDKETWREAFDHEAFHLRSAQGSALRQRGPSASGESVPRGPFLPGGRWGVRPSREGFGTQVKLA